MFFILSKILNIFILPLSWVFGLLIAAVFVKKQPLKKRLLIASVVVFYLFTNDFIADRVMTCWEIPAIPQSAIKGKYDVAIVLGGFTDYDDSFTRVQFEHGADRMLQALELYKKGMVRKLLIDGGSGSLVGNNVEAPHVRKYLLSIGIPDTDIIIEPLSDNTRQNALFAKPLLDSVAPHGKYLLVTSGYHMRRSLGCFNKVCITTLPFSTDRQGGPVKFAFDYAFIPDLKAIENWEILFHEWFGYISYKFAGYL